MGRDDELALRGGERGGRLPLLLDGAGDRLDLQRRRSAAAADHPRAQRSRLRGELGEVLRRRVRIDDSAAREAGETDVRERREGAAVAHRLERGERGVEAGSVVGADGGELVIGESRHHVGRRHAAEGLRVLVEGQHRDDRQAGNALDGLDRGRQLVELEERLDHEEVDASPVQQSRLLGEVIAPFGRIDVAQFTERADRARDVDVAPGDLARLARQLDAGLVDPLELVLEVMRAQLVAVCAERVRLDQLGAGLDEALVQRDDALGRTDIRLLRTAHSRDGARDEDAHAAVRDHGRPVFKPFLEPIGHREK